MDIRKTDSKGRLTGFPPGAYMRVYSPDAVTWTVSWEVDLLEYPGPFPQEAKDYLAGVGIPYYLLRRAGATQEGYDEFVLDESGRKIIDWGMARTVRKPWPEGFDWSTFIGLLRGGNP